MDKKTRYDYYDKTMGIDTWSMHTVSNPNKVITMNDGPCGLRQTDENGKTIVSSCGLSPSAIAASFSEEVAYKNGEILATNCKNKRVNILLAPGINIKRNLLNGRNFEYFSEDPLLAGLLGAFYVKGLQDNDVGACVKHYCCNNKEFARKVSSSEVSLRALNEIYLAPFRYLINQVKPVSLMTAYNRVNGEYVTESDYLINTKLKGEFNYKGLIMSDWHSVSNKAKTIKTGLHLQMPKEELDYERLDKALEKGEFSEDDLIRNDKEAYEAIKNIPDFSSLNYEVDLQKNHEELVKLANKSCVLVKNEGNYLPLNKKDKVLIVGYFAIHGKNVGDGSAYAKGYKNTSVIETLQMGGYDFAFARGYDERERPSLSESQLLHYQKLGYNKVVVFLGQYPEDESESFERQHFEIYPEQKETLKVVKSVYKDFATVLITGSVMNIKDVYNDSKAMMINYVSGEGQGEAIINNLFGVVNPSGRLPETWIGSLDQFPAYKDILKHYAYYEYYDEDIYVGYRYFLTHKEGFVLPFGYGLSYGKIEYTKFEIETVDDTIICKISAKNPNGFSVNAVPQIYVSKPISNVYRPLYELKGFNNVTLEANEEKDIVINIPIKYLGIYENASDSMKVESGEYIFSLGLNAIEMIMSEKVIIKGEEVKTQLEPIKLNRKPLPKDFNLDTPTGVFMAMGEKAFFDFFNSLENVDIKTIYDVMHWDGGDPVRNLCTSQLINRKQLYLMLDFYNSLPHEYIQELECV